LGGSRSVALGAFTRSTQLIDDALRGSFIGTDGVEYWFDSAFLGAEAVLRHCGSLEGALPGIFNPSTSGTYAAAIFSALEAALSIRSPSISVESLTFSRSPRRARESQ
jgi:hypothetical protein